MGESGDIPTLSLIGSGARPESAGAYLLVIHEGSSTVVPLPASGDFVIGRAPEVNLQLNDAGCSRRHAVLQLRDGEVLLGDLGSHNGTLVNGARIHGTRLLDSEDVIAIGKVVMVLHASGGASVRQLLDRTALRQRFEEEVERTARYERPLGVVAISLGEASGHAEALQLLQPQLRILDVAGNVGDGLVVLLLPELRHEAVLATTGRIVAALTPRFPRVRAGVAACPSDGCRADALLSAARTAAERADLGGVMEAGRCATELRFGERTVMLADPAMIQVFDLLRRLASSEVTVLISGETGVGKENAAFAVHHWSPRARGPFVALNCAALQETLVESELFGYEKGAFSGAAATKVGLLEAANQGTLFFDEVGELSAAAQAKLLRALEVRRVTRLGSTKEREIDVRIVAATNRNLETEVKLGRFRQDLFFRLGAARVHLPPLRDRPREVAILARAFLDELRARAQRPEMSISAACMQALTTYAWPGNVRELKNVIQFVSAATEEDTLEPWHLPESLANEPAVAAGSVPAPGAALTQPAKFRPVADELRELERQRMQDALDAAQGVQKRAADLIGMPQRTFGMKVKQYGLSDRRRT